MDEVHKKYIWHNEVHTMSSILRWNMKIMENAQKHILWSFSRFSVTIICDLKIDLIVCEAHCLKFIFLFLLKYF